jgi:TonB family protein
MKYFIRVSLSVLILCAIGGQKTAAQDVEGNGGRSIVSQASPAYPELARKMNLEGTVKLLVVVSPAGAAQNVQVVGGNPLLAKAAEDAVRKFRWSPSAQESKEQVLVRFHRPHN